MNLVLSSIRFVFITLLLAMMASSAEAQQSTTCKHTIVQTDLPYTISTIGASGVYCLGSDLTYTPSTSGTSAITINPYVGTYGVVVDLNGYSIYCSGSYCNSTNGVKFASGSSAGTQVKNGYLSEFGYGVYVDGGSGRINDMNIVGNSIISNAGIYLSGNSGYVVIERNRITGSTFGIQSWYSTSPSIFSNTISVPSTSSGIVLDGSATTGLIQGNRFLAGRYAITCASGCSAQYVVYKDNLSNPVMGWTNRYNGYMSDGGGNF